MFGISLDIFYIYAFAIVGPLIIIGIPIIGFIRWELEARADARERQAKTKG